MNINNSYNTPMFGQKVPTTPLLKMGADIFSYEDAKNLCLSFDKSFPGHVGYFNKAKSFSKRVAQKNPEIRKYLKQIDKFDNKNQKIVEILKISEKIGQEIDVVV